MFFNTHTHLNSSEQYQHLEEYLDHCRKENVTELTVVGYNKDTSIIAVELSKQYEHIHATVGISPNDLDDYKEEDLEVIETLIKENKVVALGEIGLDYHYDTPKDLQIDVFKKQLALSKKYHLPVVIHCRDAYEDTYNLLKEYDVKGIMHCYSGSVEMAKRFVNLGFYISLSGTVTFKNAKEPKKVAKEIPLEYLLIETDDPYLTPVPFRGTTNQPAYCIYVASTIAECKEIDIKVVEEATYNNAKKVFGL